MRVACRLRHNPRRVPGTRIHVYLYSRQGRHDIPFHDSGFATRTSSSEQSSHKTRSKSINSTSKMSKTQQYDTVTQDEPAETVIQGKLDEEYEKGCRVGAGVASGLVGW